MKHNKILHLFVAVMALSFLSGCSETKYGAHLIKQIPVPGERSPSKGYFKVGAPYTIKGQRYKPVETYEFVQEGVASWYGPGFHNKMTANGEIFDSNEFTAAHKTLQLPSIVKVTNLENGRSIILRVNDRGPYASDRIIDVSERGAVALGFKNNGTARVRVEVLGDHSREIADRARTGQDTGGYEIALNQNRTNTFAAQPSIPQAKPVSPPEPVTQVAMSNIPPPSNMPMNNPMPVEAQPLNNVTPATGGYYNASINNVASNVVKTNITNLETGKIYVQAGSFSQEQNALSFSNRIASYGPSRVYLTRVNNQPFFRVRLGPYEDKAQATQALAALNQSGNNNAVIVVD